MKRSIPEVGALYERVRRPATMRILGLTLMMPAAGLVLKEEPEVEPIDSSALMPLGDEPTLERAKTAMATDGEIAEAWQKRALEREREELAPKFAKRYGIPVTLAAQIHEAAVEANLDPEIAFGLVHTESSFRRTVVSYAGAVGYTQLLPSTARWIEPGTTRSDLYDTKTNLRVGFKYLNYLLDKYDGNMRLALTAYNRGPGTVDRLLRQGRNPENGYATKVLRHVTG